MRDDADQGAKALAPLTRTVLADLLRAEGLAAVLVGRPWDVPVQPTVDYLVAHLTPSWDYSGLFALLPGEGPLAVVANAWCSPDPSGTFAVQAYPGHHMRFALPVLATLLQERGLATARLGIERTHLPVGLLDEVRSVLPDATFAAGDRVLARLRVRKSAAEIASIRGPSPRRRRRCGSRGPPRLLDAPSRPLKGRSPP